MSIFADEALAAQRGLRACSGTAAVPWTALDLLALAGRSAARVAQEQSQEVEIAAQLLERAGRLQTTVWIAGDAADEHAARLESTGQRAIAIVDPSRLPASVSAGDVLVVLTVSDIPLGLLSSARQRGVGTIVLGGRERRELEVGAAIFVDCREERATELTHTFILTALCAQGIDWDEAESAA
ncbi:MAG TPA: hypothetical protein VG963_30105 [Polyangiaceae bacterium]|nr:hypothetical protein [Polyangiaceae bacterium]